ncbi:hypothetical protein TVAG_256030 [Trichomonas vaginalis G3]|uniref:Uncharacterized protein n=1 Tax=Trichomonas vaginalis (strain ATCC PRA-98 / G3) TaxID=412133 RepID=A2DZ00_TRIV3|nr:hypothetical protein TVAGG3_0869030 [Trichomonas vaginalis G3]EAY14411.1 hypothetical protein TVAG_256030 [Trichomonas vaginalis G3]KAI5501230.1 hypothetical protein TVAGG3_0869030 [Trichomonas vaginalis G3]|eukprot:XP_001326634.1 hypothetical protein [Trichomonas vaginalis G3]
MNNSSKLSKTKSAKEPAEISISESFKRYETEYQNVLKIEKHNEQLTEKSIALNRQIEALRYKNNRDQQILQVRQNFIQKQTAKIEENINKYQDDIEKAKGINNEITSVQNEGQSLIEQINSKLENLIPPEPPKWASEDEMLQYKRAKLKAIKFKNEMQKKLIQNLIPHQKEIFQLQLQAFQDRLNAADKRCSVSQKILEDQHEYLIKQKEAEISEQNDVADDAELCIARTQIDSFEFDVGNQMILTSDLEASNDQRLKNLQAKEAEVSETEQFIKQAQISSATSKSQIDFELFDAQSTIPLSESNEQLVILDPDVPQDAIVTQIVNHADQEYPDGKEKQRREDFLNRYHLKVSNFALLIRERSEIEALQLQINYAQIEQKEAQFTLSQKEALVARTKEALKRQKELFEKMKAKVDEADVGDEFIEKYIDRNDRILQESRGLLEATRKETIDAENELKELQEALNAMSNN